MVPPGAGTPNGIPDHESPNLQLPSSGLDAGRGATIPVSPGRGAAVRVAVSSLEQ
eukprot:gene33827-50574_t